MLCSVNNFEVWYECARDNTKTILPLCITCLVAPQYTTKIHQKENKNRHVMIKGNEPDLTYIVFEILAQKEFKLFCFILFSALINCSQLLIQFEWGLHQYVEFLRGWCKN